MPFQAVPHRAAVSIELNATVCEAGFVVGPRKAFPPNSDSLQHHRKRLMCSLAIWIGTRVPHYLAWSATRSCAIASSDCSRPIFIGGAITRRISVTTRDELVAAIAGRHPQGTELSVAGFLTPRPTRLSRRHGSAG
jgi:hypothetical protein